MLFSSWSLGGISAPLCADKFSETTLWPDVIQLRRQIIKRNKCQRYKQQRIHTQCLIDLSFEQEARQVLVRKSLMFITDSNPIFWQMLWVQKRTKKGIQQERVNGLIRPICSVKWRLRFGLIPLHKMIHVCASQRAALTKIFKIGLFYFTTLFSIIWAKEELTFIWKILPIKIPTSNLKLPNEDSDRK